jgi:hypothetical protein
MSWVLHFQDQTTNAYAFLLINGSLNKDKVPNLTTNHISPMAKRFANYALKTRMEGVLIGMIVRVPSVAKFFKAS